jgi:hypothetical protein
LVLSWHCRILDWRLLAVGAKRRVTPIDTSAFLHEFRSFFAILTEAIGAFAAKSETSPVADTDRRCQTNNVIIMSVITPIARAKMDFVNDSTITG